MNTGYDGQFVSESRKVDFLCFCLMLRIQTQGVVRRVDELCVKCLCLQIACMKKKILPSLLVSTIQRITNSTTCNCVSDLQKSQYLAPKAILSPIVFRERSSHYELAWDQ